MKSDFRSDLWTGSYRKIVKINFFGALTALNVFGALTTGGELIWPIKTHQTWRTITLISTRKLHPRFFPNWRKTCRLVWVSVGYSRRFDLTNKKTTINDEIKETIMHVQTGSRLYWMSPPPNSLYKRRAKASQWVSRSWHHFSPKSWLDCTPCLDYSRCHVALVRTGSMLMGGLWGSRWEFQVP